MWLTIVAGSTAMPLEGGALIVMHGRSRMTIDHCTPTMPGRSTPSFHRPGRDCLHQALQSAVRCSASRMKDELHPTTVRTVCGGYVRAQVRLTGVNHVKTLEGHNLSTSTCNPGNDLPLYSLLACMAGRLQFGNCQSEQNRSGDRPYLFDQNGSSPYDVSSRPAFLLVCSLMLSFVSSVYLSFIV